jgi:hypothetical protein
MMSWSHGREVRYTPLPLLVLVVQITIYDGVRLLTSSYSRLKLLRRPIRPCAATPHYTAPVAPLDQLPTLI